MIGHWEMLLRITIAAELGGAIGVERNIHSRQAGLRTLLESICTMLDLPSSSMQTASLCLWCPAVRFIVFVVVFLVCGGCGCRSRHRDWPEPSSMASSATNLGEAFDATARCPIRLTRPWEVTRASPMGGPLQACRLRRGGLEFDVVLTTPSLIDIFYYDHGGKGFGSIDALRRGLESRGLELLMAMNAGMFTPSHVPVGLLISAGETIRDIDLREGDGNFYLKPNGVFALTNDNEASVLEASSREIVLPTWRAATQSGPLLLREGQEHSAFRPDSTNRYIRNGVGIRDSHTVVFAISNVPVTFHDMVDLFVATGCHSALYLDGTVSEMYLPVLGRHAGKGALGPMIAVTTPAGGDR